MIEWTYDELKNAIRQDIDEYERDSEYDYSPGQVAGRCLYEYTTVCSSGYTETMIVYTEIGIYIIEKCPIESIREFSNKIKENLGMFKKEMLDEELTKEEVAELEKKINGILHCL